MNCDADPWPVRISLVGTFRVTRSGDVDITPRGRKACAILAILAMTESRCRSRAVLQGKLWSDRAPEQASASLRQALAEIRRALGPSRDCLKADLQTVSLVPERVTTDLDELDRAELARSSRGDLPVLLEGLDIRDREFEHWLRDRRLGFEDELNETLLPSDATGHGTLTAASSNGVFAHSHPATFRPAPGARPRLRLAPQRVSSGDSAAFIGRFVGIAVGNDLRDMGDVEVIQGAVADGEGIALEIEVAVLAGQTSIHASMIRDPDGHRLWSGAVSLRSDNDLLLDSHDVHHLTNQLSELCTLHFKQLAALRGDRVELIAFRDAVGFMFEGHPAGLERAEHLLRGAQAGDRKGVALALEAFSLTFRVGETQCGDLNSMQHRARELCSEAVSLEPGNATVLAICSYVRGFVLHEFHASHDLAERSLRQNSRHPLALAFLARAKCYLGAYEDGYRLAMRARTLAQPPFRCSINFIAVLAALLAGRFEEAVALAETTISEAPTYRAAHRYLAPLYLRVGRPDAARRVVTQLRELEPDFSLETFWDDPIRAQAMRMSTLPRYRDVDC